MAESPYAANATAMSLQSFTNSFDGQSLLITPGANLEDVPSPFVELLTDDHRAAFADPADYFGTLASQCTIGSMKTWLRVLAEANTCSVEINTSRWAMAVIVKVAGFQISLRIPVDLPPPGRALQHLYSLMMGTWHDGFPCAGGLHEPRTVTDYGLVIESDIEIPEDAVAFFATACGDSLIASGNTAYWYSHETFDLHPEGTVIDVLSSYFNHLLQGTEGEFGYPN